MVEVVKRYGGGMRVREQRGSERARAFAKAGTRQARCRRCWVTMQSECELQIGTRLAYCAVIRLSNIYRCMSVQRGTGSMLIVH